MLIYIIFHNFQNDSFTCAQIHAPICKYRRTQDEKFSFLLLFLYQMVLDCIPVCLQPAYILPG